MKAASRLLAAAPQMCLHRTRLRMIVHAPVLSPLMPCKLMLAAAHKALLVVVHLWLQAGFRRETWQPWISRHAHSVATWQVGCLHIWSTLL